MIPVSEAREQLADLVNRAAYRQERITLGLRGKKIAAIVSAEDLELLEALEDAADLRLIAEALADPANKKPPIPYNSMPSSEVARRLLDSLCGEVRCVGCQGALVRGQRRGQERSEGGRDVGEVRGIQALAVVSISQATESRVAASRRNRAGPAPHDVHGQRQRNGWRRASLLTGRGVRSDDHVEGGSEHPVGREVGRGQIEATEGERSATRNIDADVELGGGRRPSATGLRCLRRVGDEDPDRHTGVAENEDAGVRRSAPVVAGGWRPRSARHTADRLAQVWADPMGVQDLIVRAQELALSREVVGEDWREGCDDVRPVDRGRNCRVQSVATALQLRSVS